MQKILMGTMLAAAGLLQAAVNGVIKDDKGNPVAGALVIQEGTSLGDVTDADGKFELSSNVTGILPTLQKKQMTANLRVDAQGRFFRGENKVNHKIYLTKKGVAQPEERSSPALAKKSAANDANLLISHAGHFGEMTAIDGTSSAPLALSMELISEFGKSNKVDPSVANLNVLEFNDSTVLAVDVESKENPICKGGKVVYLPDTTEMQYKIAGKTMYMWDPEDTDSLGNYATVLTSSTGNKMSAWNWNGMTMSPMTMVTDSSLWGPADSITLMVRDIFKVSGITTFSNTKIHNDVVFGICFGPMIAMGFTQPPITATAKSCNEAEFKNGAETATLSFTDNGIKAITKFTYKDTSCVTEGATSSEPAYSCNGIAEGRVPSDTSTGSSAPTYGDLVQCPAFIEFMMGGMDIPGIPLGKRTANIMPSPMSLERKARARIPKMFR